MKKRKYTVQERADYHKKRTNSYDVSSRKKSYSMNWLDGYNDSHAERNYLAVCSEITAKKKNGGLLRNEAVALYGYRNGLKAKLSKNNRPN